LQILTGNATQARKKLKIEWDTKGYENFSTTDYENHLRELAKQDGMVDKNIGAVDALIFKRKIPSKLFMKRQWWRIMHLEPMNCVAAIQGDKVEIWTSSQVNSTITGSGANDLHKLSASC
jgi:isoquinoline 1-oxidoreductase beta subunit